MIAVIRIAGQVKQKQKDKETLNRLKLRKKFSCILVEESDAVRLGMVRAVKHCVAYGKIDEELIKKLKKAKEKKGVFFLHPPVGGFKKSSKLAFPNGILGENKEISKLLERMV